MKRESDAILLRIFIGEADKHEGKPLYKHILELCRKEGLAGATVIRGVDGFSEASHLHTTAILRLSTDLPIIIEVADKKENIEKIKEKLDDVIEKGLVTEEKVKIFIYKGNKK